jgi:flagellar biosynthetic protein FliR
MQIKALLAIAISFVIYPALMWPGTAAGGNVIPMVGTDLPFWGLIAMIAMELSVGVIIGYGAMLPLIGVQLGGRIMDQQMGLGLAGVLNPEFDEETGIISEIYFIFAVTVFVIIGGHHALFRALVNSFDHVPLGGFRMDERLMMDVLGMVQTIFELALRVAAPLLCIVFLETLAMGFIARTVPQMNILSVGFAVRLLIGGWLLMMAIGLHAGVFRETMEDVLLQLMNLFQREGP